MIPIHLWVMDDLPRRLWEEMIKVLGSRGLVDPATSGFCETFEELVVGLNRPEVSLANTLIGCNYRRRGPSGVQVLAQVRKEISRVPRVFIFTSVVASATTEWGENDLMNYLQPTVVQKTTGLKDNINSIAKLIKQLFPEATPRPS